MYRILILGYLSYRNSVRAKQKGLNQWVWAMLTVAAFFSALVVGCFVVVLYFAADSTTFAMLQSTDEEVRNAASQQILEVLGNSPLQLITIDIFGFGGYLLIRYILERKPDKKEPEIHWMDKLGGNN